MCGTVIRTEVDDIYDSGREEGTKDIRRESNQSMRQN